MFWIRIAHFSEMIRTFHGEEPAGFLLTHEKDFSNISPTEQLDLLEARWANLNLARLSKKRTITNRGGKTHRFDLDGIARVRAAKGHLIWPTNRWIIFRYFG
jgi:hypothetical protein